ncbi:hypothetical protein SynPROS91_00994 [Synechococcus sp. PROS-9-1]|nr:hypothetical protein SynPROS91_00994 [Synechococcus sp. PROS-9-1]
MHEFRRLVLINTSDSRDAYLMPLRPDCHSRFPVLGLC